MIFKAISSSLLQLEARNLLRRRLCTLVSETQPSDRSLGVFTPGKLLSWNLRLHSCELYCLLLASGDLQQSPRVYANTGAALSCLDPKPSHQSVASGGALRRRSRASVLLGEQAELQRFSEGRPRSAEGRGRRPAARRAILQDRGQRHRLRPAGGPPPGRATCRLAGSAPRSRVAPAADSLLPPSRDLNDPPLPPSVWGALG